MLRPLSARPILVEKLVSLIIVSVALATLSVPQLQSAFIFLGQGHFVATYYYQHKRGIITNRCLRWYLIAFGVLSLSYLATNAAVELMALTAIYFAIHFLLDERHLLGVQPSASATLDLFPPFVLFTAYVIDSSYGLQTKNIAIILSAEIIAVHLYLRLRAKLLPRLETLYFWTGVAILYGVFFFQVPMTLVHLFGAVILYHYSNWYLHFFLRYSERPDQRRTYLIEIVLINAVICGLALLYQLNVPVGLSYVFAPAWFNIWTIMHLIFTTRRTDFRVPALLASR